MKQKFPGAKAKGANVSMRPAAVPSSEGTACLALIQVLWKLRVIKDDDVVVFHHWVWS